MYGEYYGSTMTTEHLLTHHEQQADAPRFLDSIPSELEQLWDKFCRVLPETGLDQSEQMRALWMDTDMPQILRDRALLSSQVRHPIASKVHIEAYAAWQKELLAYVVSTGKTEVYDNESMAHAMMRLFGDGWISRTEFEDFLEHFGVERADGIFRQLIRPKLGYGLLSAKDSKQPSIPVLFPILHMDVYAADGEGFDPGLVAVFEWATDGLYSWMESKATGDYSRVPPWLVGVPTEQIDEFTLSQILRNWQTYPWYDTRRNNKDTLPAWVNEFAVRQFGPKMALTIIEQQKDLPPGFLESPGDESLLRAVALEHLRYRQRVRNDASRLRERSSKTHTEGSVQPIPPCHDFFPGPPKMPQSIARYRQLFIDDEEVGGLLTEEEQVHHKNQDLWNDYTAKQQAQLSAQHEQDVAQQTTELSSADRGREVAKEALRQVLDDVYVVQNAIVPARSPR
jgi:hypothetical protein